MQQELKETVTAMAELMMANTVQQELR